MGLYLYKLTVTAGQPRVPPDVRQNLAVLSATSTHAGQVTYSNVTAARWSAYNGSRDQFRDVV